MFRPVELVRHPILVEGVPGAAQVFVHPALEWFVTGVVEIAEPLLGEHVLV